MEVRGEGVPADALLMLLDGRRLSPALFEAALAGSLEFGGTVPRRRCSLCDIQSDLEQQLNILHAAAEIPGAARQGRLPRGA